MIRTIFLDFGNVIGFFDHWRTVMRLLPFTDLPANELHEAIYGGELEEQYELGQLSTERFVRLARKAGRLNCTSEEFVSAFGDIFWINDEVCDLIPRLANNYRLVLASNTNPAHYARYTAQFADVLKYFSALCPSHLVQARKPWPQFFAACQEHAEADPSECLFIDDLTENIESAKAFGWRGMVYRPGMGLKSSGVLPI